MARASLSSMTFALSHPTPWRGCARRWRAWRSGALRSTISYIAGSLVIALAVAEGHLPADKAFAAAQLDELHQIERWGEDPIATHRHASIKHDIDAGARFLALLAEQRLKG